jgi:hypothetical protein
VEQVMDAAIERIAVERSARERTTREPTVREPSGANPKGSAELARRSPTEAALARREAAQASRVPTRLRWKGLDVSDEFRQYAERIARGEELPPFEGRVLAEPNPAFPWGGDDAVAEAEPKPRGAHPAVWGAAIVVLGLLGWSIALKLEGAEPSASVETTVAPLAATAELEAKPSTPPDEVETPSPDAPAPATEPATARAEAPAAAESTPAVASSPSPVPAMPALASEVAPATSAPSPPPAPAKASVSVDLARPGALQQAVGAALAGHNAAVRAAPAAASASVRDDEFGIMASVSPAPATSGATSGAVAPAPAGAKSNGSVGDLARAGQPAGSGVRKEPGSESSAKGSLLVETPSF